MARRVSLRDVAEGANVSPATVSNYLNGSAPVSSATSQRIQDVIDRLGYQRNEIARSLRSDKTRTLGMIVPGITNPFYTAVFMGAEEEVRRQGYTITLGTTKFDHREIEHYLNVFQGKQVDGIIIEGSATYSVENLPSRHEVPIVIVEPPGKTKWSSVHIDNLAASRELVDHLLGLGHRRIATITPGPVDIRLDGFIQALTANGVPIDEDLFIFTGQYQDDLLSQGANAMRELLARRRPGVDFTACFCNNDMMAMGAIREAKAQGCRIPDDIAVTGFDDIPFAALIDPPLTTIAQPMEDMGRFAARILLEQLASKEPLPICNEILPHRLVVRGSTQPNPSTE